MEFSSVVSRYKRKNLNPLGHRQIGKAWLSSSASENDMVLSLMCICSEMCLQKHKPKQKVRDNRVLYCNIQRKDLIWWALCSLIHFQFLPSDCSWFSVFKHVQVSPELEVKNCLCFYPLLWSLSFFSCPAYEGESLRVDVFHFSCLIFSYLLQSSFATTALLKIFPCKPAMLALWGSNTGGICQLLLIHWSLLLTSSFLKYCSLVHWAPSQFPLFYLLHPHLSPAFPKLLPWVFSPLCFSCICTS